MESFEQRLQRLAAERERIAREEASMREEAQRELDRVVAEIERLEERREVLESFLNINESDERAAHGRIRNICFDILLRYPEGLTSGQIKEIVEREYPGVRVASVAATLSRQAAVGRLQRDALGRYTLSDRLRSQGVEAFTAT